MNIFKKILIWLVSIIVLLAIAGFFLPRKVVIERSNFINASPTMVYNQLNDVKTYNNWMTWNRIDPQMKQVYGATTVGKDASYTWDSEHSKVGKGSLVLTQSIPYEKVVAQMHFKKGEPAESIWLLTPKDKGTLIQWQLNSDMGYNPFGRWFGLFFDKLMGPDFETGLSNLKEVVEKLPTSSNQKDPRVEIEPKTVPELLVLYTIETAASTAEIGSKLGAAYGEIGNFMKQAGINSTGMPAATYQSQQAPFHFEAWIPIEKKPVVAAGRIKVKQVAGGKMLVAHVFGPYELGYKAFDIINAYMKEKGLQPNGQPYEVYVNDPTTVSDPYLIQTDMYVPVK